MRFIFDTNFIIACLRKKIEIFENIERINEDSNLEIIILSPVFKELEKFSLNKKKKFSDRNLAKIFLQMIKENKIEVKIVESNQKNPDEAIKLYCLKNPEVIIGTLDKKLRKSLNNKILTIKGRKIIFA
ncbi:MAG: PIN domain-containing protein [Candidatus Pacearchaeota archaeon]